MKSGAAIRSEAKYESPPRVPDANGLSEPCQASQSRPKRRGLTAFEQSHVFGTKRVTE
jgi:hypothetical protein